MSFRVFLPCCCLKLIVFRYFRIKGRILLHQIFPSPSCIIDAIFNITLVFNITMELSPWRAMVIRINMAAEKQQGNAFGFLLFSTVIRWFGRKTFSPLNIKVIAGDSTVLWIHLICSLSYPSSKTLGGTIRFLMKRGCQVID